MKTAGRAVIVVASMAALIGVVWMFTGREASDAVIGNSQVIGALAGVAAFLVAVVVLWPRVSRRSAEPVPAGQARAAVVYLATETLRYWRLQAKDRRITTPSPASVRWAWADAEVAVPASELQPKVPADTGGLVLGELPPQVLTAGVVTQLREQLYEGLDDTRRRIVVLGGPGAGKTVAMLLLLIEILEHRAPDSDQPVPVWLTLGGWNPHASPLLDWTAATLARDYPGLSAPAHGGPGTAAELIRTGRVALFLDGLDEMAPAIQGDALKLIDRDATGLNVVLTSRPTEYHTALAGGQLFGAAVIDVLPVDVNDAEVFLLAEQLGQHRAAWQHVTEHLRDHPDSVAARTLTTPLALTLARDTYTTADPTDLLDTQAHPDPDALLQHLLASSLTLAYPDPAERAQATEWLSWTTRHMGTSRDLRWWEIPAWSPLWQLRLVFGLLAGLVIGLTFGLAGLTRGLTDGLTQAFFAGILGLLLGGQTADVKREPMAFTMRWPTREDVSRHLPALVIASFPFLVPGLPLALAGGLVGVFVLVVVGVFVLVALLMVVLFESWATPLATAHAVDPMQVYRSDGRRILVGFLTAGLAFGLPCGLAFGLAFGLPFGLGAGLAFGLGGGLFFGILAGVGPSSQLAAVQVIWWLRGRRVRFLPLLQTALHRQVLRQAGAVYQFRHAALQDLLASRGSPTGVMDIENPASQT